MFIMTKSLPGVLPSLCSSFTFIYITINTSNLTLLSLLFLIVLPPTPYPLPEMRDLRLLVDADHFLWLALQPSPQPPVEWSQRVLRRMKAVLQAERGERIAGNCADAVLFINS